MSKREYQVTIPVAGHAFVTVEATSEEEAVEIAMNEATMRDIDGWEFLERFNQGNVCYCPSPWEIEVQDMGEADE